MGLLYASATVFPGFDIDFTNVVLTFHGSCEIRKTVDPVTGDASYFVMGFWDLYSKQAYDFNNTPNQQEALKQPIIRSTQKCAAVTAEQLNTNAMDLLYTAILVDIPGGTLY